MHSVGQGTLLYMPKHEFEAELIICKKVDPVAKERFEFLLELYISNLNLSCTTNRDLKMHNKHLSDAILPKYF